MNLQFFSCSKFLLDFTHLELTNGNQGVKCDQKNTKLLRWEVMSEFCNKNLVRVTLGGYVRVTFGNYVLKPCEWDQKVK